MTLNTPENVTKVRNLQKELREVSWDEAVVNGAAYALSEKLRSSASPRERYDALKDFHHVAFTAGCISAMTSLLTVTPPRRPDNLRAAGLDTHLDTKRREFQADIDGQGIDARVDIFKPR